MKKRLIKYTTIPDNLYVNRNADNQLKNIIEEMQRPGYVLVARQMGKTNLLFNAKRKLENPNRLFAYIDLSNVFTKERECYRNLIDNIIEPNSDLFFGVKENLTNLREEKLPPHNEYFRSLRVILEHFKGDIIIILDEIDALRSVDYSDNIFAQIRSNYFSRTSYKVFERLTYILSGVIEPTELIKDKNKSPFNIGEKIYLDDFSFDEHTEFLKRSELNLSPELSYEIFKWTKGNPRLTFDICSSIESFKVDGIEITNETVSEIIKSKYLTTYDIAPIDHIRELVKSDKKVRNAIICIHRKKSDELSDEIKKKLYLYGIINSKFDEETKIKNPIIELCLTEEWIKSIERQTQDNFTYGLEKMDQLEFDEAIHSLAEFLSNANPTKQQEEICNYNIGFGYYKLREYEKAIDFFSKEYTIALYKGNSKALFGICKIGLSNIDEGINILEDVIKNRTYDFAYRSAVLNLTPLIAKNDKNRALKLYDDLFDSTLKNSDDTPEIELNKLRTLAYYFKAEIYFENKEIDNTYKALKEALKYSTLSDSLYLKYSILNISKDKDVNLLLEIIDTIIESKLKFDKEQAYPISFNENHILGYLALSFELGALDGFEKLLEYSYDKLFNRKIDKYLILYNSSKESSKQTDILKYILAKRNFTTESVIFNSIRDLSFILSSNSSEFFTYFNEYIVYFSNNNNIVNNDIYLFAIAIKHYSDIKKIDEALELCLIIESRIKDIEDDELKFESLIIYYWLSNLNFSKGIKLKAIEYADKTISLIVDSKNERTSMIDEKGLKVIAEQMNQIKRSSIIRNPIINKKKYSRNDKVKVQYLNGKIQEGKYKKFEADILADRCKIISNL